MYRLLVSSFVIWVLSTFSLFAETSVVNLRVDNRVEPVGVHLGPGRTGDTPLFFSWNLQDDRPGCRQKAYRIRIGASSSLDDSSVLWDSGWVAGPQCIDVPYLGAEFESSKKYHWIVEVKTDRETIVRPDRTASFITGIRSKAGNKGQWEAKWISIPRTDKDPLPIFRKPFQVNPSKSIETACVHICGLGHYELRLNGKKVGDRFIDPGWTNYRKTCLYSSYDVTGQLRPGENVFGVLLGNGMYNVAGGRYVKFKGSFGLPKLICLLSIRYTDGTSETVCSDESWTGSLGLIVFSCVYGGEDIDFRRVQAGWDEPGFREPEGTWQPVEIVPDTEAELVAQEAPPVVVANTLRPESVRRLPDGRYLADFGYNFSGRPHIRLKGRAGDRVTVKTAEIIDKIWNGHSYTVTLRGEETELLLPKFTYFGFQFLYIEGALREEDRTQADAAKPILVSVKADFTTSSAEKVGSFRCSDELFNDIDTMVDRSVRSNLQSVLTDCPHREKLGWLEVAHLMGPSIISRYDVHNLYRKICRDMTESQLDNGHVPDIAPEYTRFSKGFFESPEWGSASVQIPWLLYLCYGDREILSRQYETMCRYVDYLATTRDEQGLVKPGLGDWYDWSEEKGHAGYSQHTPKELTATAIFIDNLRILMKVAELLDRDPAEKEAFKNLSDEAWRDYFAAYAPSGSETVSTGSQSALAETLFVLGKRDETFDHLLQKLVERIEADRFKPTTGEVSFPRMLRTLAQGNRDDIIWKLIHRTDKPGYGYMLRQRGMKTLSETWDGPGTSMNHCMFGHVQEWFGSQILGINPVRSRFADFSEGRLPCFMLNPTPVGDLAWAEGHYDSVYGRVESSWKVEQDRLVYRCSVPANTSAELLLQEKEIVSLSIFGKSSDPKNLTRTDQGRIILESGVYEFIVIQRNVADDPLW